MRRLSQKQLLRLASLILTGLTVVFGILWVVRGLRPAIECGVLDYVGSGDWSAAYACVDLTDYDGVLFALGLVGSFVFWLRSRKAPDTPLGEYHPTPVEQARNRKGMIDRVWAIWIEGHLEQALYQAVLMSLGMTLRPAALRPGSVRVRKAGEQERAVPEYISTAQLFDEAGRTLLILGEPGSGKTTMMLDLARSLLERAREDESTPIPVVFNLSSLIEPEQSLDDWLVDEFRSSYQVPEKVARFWLAHDELALLLDGLDEVRADRRAGVVEKIDQYRAQHMDPSLVICCRQNEYVELVANEAAVEGADALVLQPLTQAQIKGYLADLTGDEPKRLWSALQGDDVLLELADTSLMLNVMLLAAEQLDWSVLPSGQGREAVRTRIYDAYIRSMLARPRTAERRYPDAKTLHWLRWLARKMVVHGQTVFLLERMKRSWFDQPWQRFSWVLIFGLIFGLTYGVILKLITVPSIWLSIWPSILPSTWLTGGLMYCLMFGLMFGLDDIDVREQISFRFEKVWLLFGLLSGLVSGLLFGLQGWLTVEVGDWLSTENNGWLSGLASHWLVFGLKDQLLSGLLFGLLSGLVSGLLFGLIDTSTVFESNYAATPPNAAISQSLRSGLIVGLIGGLLFGPSAGLIFWLVFGRIAGLIGGLIYGLYIGLLLGLFFGWMTVIKHYTLRLILFLDGSMPLNYVRFLDYCVNRVLLRRVGGGYMFIHRTMMEHIAGLDLEKWKVQPDSP